MPAADRSRRAVLRGLLGGATLLGAAACDTGHRTAGPGPGAARRSVPEPVRGLTRIDGAEIATAAWVQEENRRPGTDRWVIRGRQYPHGIEGYAGQVSARTGETVTLHVSTGASSFDVEVYRLGWYRGTGGRLMRSLGPFAGAQHLLPAPGAANIVECDWPVSVALQIEKDWPTGVYLCKLIGSDGQGAYLPLTVRDDTSTAAYQVMNSVTTWQAYNRWGGYSLYQGSGTFASSQLAAGTYPQRARVVSFDRPYPYDWAFGAADLLGAEYPLIALLERAGADVSYWTDVDFHAQPARLHQHRVLLSLGHDEYWSKTMFDAALTARDHGVSLMFLGANAAFRHIRLDASRLAPNRRQTCYKDAAEDPLHGIDDADLTVDWPSGPLPRAESQFIGNAYAGNPCDDDLVIDNPGSWLWSGLDLGPDIRLPHVIGTEFDRYQPTQPCIPRNVDVLSHSPVVSHGRPNHSDITWYTAPSGAGIFATGTNAWINRLADADGQVLELVPRRTPHTTEALTRATLNVLAVLSGTRPAAHLQPSRGTWRNYYSPNDIASDPVGAV